MKIQTIILLLLLILGTTPTLQSATLKGTVTAKVEIQGQSAGKTGSYGSRKYKFLEKVDYSKFRDFVISLEAIDAPSPPANPTEEKVLQKNGMFIPHVLPIVAGSSVEWPNQDDIFHNVFSISETRPFDLGYYKKRDDAKVVVFKKPGRVDVFCSIHSQINCIVLVMPNDLFAISDKRGRYEIKNIPAGRYLLKAWHERLPTKSQEITIGEDETIELEIVMGLADLPKI